MREDPPVQRPSGEIVVYEASDGGARVEVLVAGDTVWLSRKQMADLFDTTIRNVGLHIGNAFADGELSEGATVKDSFIVRSPALGRQQADRLAVVPRLPAPEQRPAGIQRPAAFLGHGTRGTRPASRRE